MLNTRLLSQNPTVERSHVFRTLQRHLRSQGVVRFRAAVAYATWGGLSLIADDLEEFLRAGKTLETLYGIDNGVTTPDALLYSVYLRRKFPRNYKVAKSYRWEYLDSEFHPKYFEFEYPDRAVSIIGSGNLTSGGLACNHELSIAITSIPGSALNRDVRTWWSHYVSAGKTITPQVIRDIQNTGQLGIERRPKTGQSGTPSALGLALPRAAKPLFQHVLDDVHSRRTRLETLADGDTLTERPNHLYLQVLEHETGGGHQIQLPVATLATFFGVGPGITQSAEFVFPELSDSVQVQLTHFPNNTHRVRLRPLKDIPRPAILLFKRTGDPGRYECTMVSPARYTSVLRRRCLEQTRAGSRRWGFVN